MKYIFITTTARSGGNLVARMLSAHDKIEIAVDPFLETFKYLRNILLKNVFRQSHLDYKTPFFDYYFNKTFPKAVKILNEASLLHPINKNDLNVLKFKQKQRLLIQCPELIKFLDQENPKNIRSLLQKGFQAILRSRGVKSCSYVGIKDSWIIELFPALS